MSAEQNTQFAKDFRRHLMPRLEALLPNAALAIVTGDASYGESFNDLRWFAWRRGASFLANDILIEMEEWLHARLLTEIERLEAEQEPSDDVDATLAMELPSAG